MGEYKPQMAASLRRIRHIFMHDWDPIGIGSIEDWRENEYDAYVMPVYTILRQQKGERALWEYLAQVYEHIMGVRAAPLAFREQAEKFLEIDVREDELHH